MATYNIISASTGNVKAVCTPVYHGTFLKPSYLEISQIASDTPINWEIGDYIVYDRTYKTYKLYDIPQPDKKSGQWIETSGGAISIEGDCVGDSFVYSNVKFYDSMKMLEICPFRDLVYKNSAYYFSTLNSVSTFENVQGIVNRIAKNLLDYYPNESFDIELWPMTSEQTELMSEAREFTLSGGSCLDALNKIYEVWENVGWVSEYSQGTTYIYVGFTYAHSANWNVISGLTYGKGKGLTALKKGQANAGEMATRLFCYGSSRNILNRYYNNLKDSNNNNIYQNENVHIPNLMLPFQYDGDDVWGKTSNRYDASKCYLDNSQAQAEYGLLTKYVYFDGSEREEIYPSLEKATVALLRAAKSSTSTGSPNFYPSPLVYTDGSTRLDEVDAVISAPSDDGEISKDGKRASEEYQTTLASSTNSDTSRLEYSKTFTLVSHQFSSAQGILNASFTGNIVLNVVTQGIQFSTVNAYYSVYDTTGTVVFSARIGTDNNKSSFSFPMPDITCGSAERPVNGNVSIMITLYGTVDDTAPVTTPFNVTYGYTAGDIRMGISVALTKTFTLKLRQIGFDMMARASLSGNSRPTIVMKDGQCIARNFEVKSATYIANEDKWSVVCYRGDDTSVGMRYPNTSYPIAAGDHFVLLDLAMPDEYVGMAANRLYEAGQALLSELSTMQPSYEPTIDAKAALGMYIVEGYYMEIEDYNIVEDTEYILIDTVTIYENESSIPTYKVTLRDKKKQSFTQSIESAIKGLVSEGSSQTSSSSQSGGGVTEYSELNGLPTLNGVIIDGDKTSEQYGLAAADHTHSGVYLPLSGGGEVTGSISASGGFYDTSDERLKDFDGDLKLSLEKINSIPKKYFRYKADKTCKRFIGTSAQSLNEVLPECVTKRSDGYFVVDYSKLSIVSLYAIGLLTKRIEMLEKNR